MQRRTFFQSIGSSLLLILVPKWARARLAGAGASQDNVSLQDVAVVVLPQSLGPKRISEVAAAFERWIQGYQEGADAGYGYGHTHLAVTGPNPSLHYAEQLKQLDAAAASAKGGRFAALGDQDKRAILQAALLQAGVTSIPRRPNGKHVASDLMSYFYSSSDGIDFRYNAEIREKDCRGLASSTKRPAPLS
jgi:hypothetical protein